MNRFHDLSANPGFEIREAVHYLRNIPKIPPLYGMSTRYRALAIPNIVSAFKVIQ